MLTTSLSLIWGQTSELVCSLRSHIDYLCADTLAGRKAGSAEALMAAEEELEFESARAEEIEEAEEE